MAAGDDSHRPALRLQGVRKSYGQVVAVAGVDLTVDEGEFFTLLGPSGSGKTTLLRLIAGFERPDAGRIELGGRDVTSVPPYLRDTNTVFQDYALFPHMSVAENIAYGLRVKRVSRQQREKRVQRALDMVRLTGLGGRRPNQLSGGVVRGGVRFVGRPEKVRPLGGGGAAAAGMIVEPGEVAEVIYVGMSTRYVVHLERGEHLVAVRQNMDALGDAERFEGRSVR